MRNNVESVFKAYDGDAARLASVGIARKEGFGGVVKTNTVVGMPILGMLDLLEKIK